MGRFTAWAENRAEKGCLDEKQDRRRQYSHTSEELRYLVDNSELASEKSRGIRFRSSPQQEDKDFKRRPAPFGSIVRGALSEDGEWLKVGKRYLPMHVSGKRVLLRVWWDGHMGEEEVVSNSDDDPAENFAEEKRRWSSVPSPAATRPIDPGAGVLYEVVADRVFIRAAPGLQARTCGTRTKGQVIEVFDWDSSRCWRRTLCARTMAEGWVLLDHPELGPLARPKDLPFSVRPLEPLCAAAREGAAADLRRFLAEGAAEEGRGPRRRLSEVRDVDGRGPLLVAAVEGHLDCCLALLEGGAQLSEKELLSLPATSACRSLIEAVMGRDFEPKILDDGLAELSQESQELADRLIDAAIMAQLAPPSATTGAASDQEEEEEEHNREEASPRVAEDVPNTVLGGCLHEVVHKAVFIRDVPSGSGAPVSSLKRGDCVDVLDYDASRQWGRVEVQKPQGLLVGWVLLEHSELGVLLRRATPEGAVQDRRLF